MERYEVFVRFDSSGLASTGLATTGFLHWQRKSLKRKDVNEPERSLAPRALPQREQTLRFSALIGVGRVDDGSATELGESDF